MSSISPAVGTVYPSLPAFKLDVFERGLQGSLWLSTRTASPNGHSQIHCAIKVGAEKQFCSFRIVARNGHGVTKVTIVETEHSCEGHDTESKRIAARSKMHEMVEKAKSEKDRFENTAATQGDTADDQEHDIQLDDSTNSTSYGDRDWNDKVDGSSQEDSDLDSNESDKATTPAPTKQRDRGPRVSKQDFQKIYPPARDVQREIDQLKQRSTVQPPSPLDSFDTPRQLLVVLYAFAQQRNFTINRGYPDKSIINPSTLRMHCSRYASRYKKTSNGGRCRFTLHASKNQDGTWRLDPVTTEHNHDVVQIANSTQSSDQGVERKSDYIETSKPQLSLPIASNFSYNPFPLTSVNHHQNSSDTISHFSQCQPLAPFASVSSTHPTDLVSFLRSFHFSPITLPHLLEKLRESGVDSLVTLLEIFMMEVESLEIFVRMLNDEEVGMQIFEMVQQMRLQNA